MEIKEISIKYKLPEKQFLRRADGRIEWVCKHGVGHTVWFPKGSDDIHCCDNCCKRLKC